MVTIPRFRAGTLEKAERVVLMIRKRKTTILVLAVIAGLAAAGLSAGAARQTGPAGDPARPGEPETAVEHRNTQGPAVVDRHWTPDRFRQAEENMRHQTGPSD
ncbi:hypothetical protein AB0M80_06890 [Amycolatopsis sp. NPDC051045]|uniref:hypothetical protein n=1 Tax=Amycolatopsis sp. NPDC051045 TaxID=3156922 RepID=UPI0034237D21